MFTIATGSNALHAEDGHGPLSASSKDDLNAAIDAFRRSRHRFSIRGDFELEPPPFSPVALRTYFPSALLVREDSVVGLGGQFLADTIVGEVDFGTFGLFQVFDLDAVEARLLPIANFVESRFRFAKRVSVFGESGLRYVGDTTNVSSWNDLEDRRPGPLRTALIERLALTRQWASQFLSFDGILYVNPSIVTPEFGLRLGNLTCEVVSP